MNPIILLGGAAALILFLMTRKTHAMVRRGTPYDETGGSSFEPPPAGTPPADGGFAKGPDKGIGDDYALKGGKKRKKTFGGMSVERGSSLRRQKELSENLKARAEAASVAAGLGEMTKRTLMDTMIANTHPEDTDAWLVLYNDDPYVLNAMKSWNFAAGDLLNRWADLGVVHPGWTKDLGWAGGLTSAEQMNLLAAARKHIGAGNSPNVIMTEKQMLDTLRSAFARSTQHPINDLKTSPQLVTDLIQQYLIDVAETPEPEPGRYINWPNPAVSQEAERLSSEAWDALARDVVGEAAPGFSTVSPGFRRLINKVMVQAIYTGLPPTVILPYIEQWAALQVAAALKKVLEEFPDMDLNDAKAQVEAELGFSAASVEAAWSEASSYATQGEEAWEEVDKWL